MSTLRINGRDVRPGDVIVFLGVAHLITAIDPYPDEPGWRIARGADDGWTITLVPDGWYDVVPGQS